MEKKEYPLEKSTLMLRLERNQREVGQLKTTLSSYICEPKTYSLYERIEVLKNRLENLSRTNREIILALKGRKKSVEGYVERVSMQLMEFHELQKGVADYLKRV